MIQRVWMKTAEIDGKEPSLMKATSSTFGWGGGLSDSDFQQLSVVDWQITSAKGCYPIDLQLVSCSQKLKYLGKLCRSLGYGVLEIRFGVTLRPSHRYI